MTQSTSHRRSPSSPHASKPKLNRPVLHRRGGSAFRSISKLGAGNGHSHSSSTASHSRGKEDDAEFDMAASFLNFCAMCENQITVPNNSLLYCSESCRRKDSRKPLSASMPSMTNMSSYSTSTTPPTSPPLSPRTIVAPMTPTRPIPSIRIPTMDHDSKTDLDPTEWKPVIEPRASSLASSDAWAYLSTFHGGKESMLARRPARSAASLPALIPTGCGSGSGSGSAGHSRVPSLTNAPSIASSISSDASDYLSMYEAPSNRPLPPRHNPYFGHGSGVKGVELVVPLSEKENHDVPVEVVDVPDVWEDDHVSVHKKTAPISMVRGGGSARV